MRVTLNQIPPSQSGINLSNNPPKRIHPKMSIWQTLEWGANSTRKCWICFQIISVLWLFITNVKRRIPLDPLLLINTFPYWIPRETNCRKQAHQLLSLWISMKVTHSLMPEVCLIMADLDFKEKYSTPTRIEIHYLMILIHNLSECLQGWILMRIDCDDLHAYANYGKRKNCKSAKCTLHMALRQQQK